MAQKNQNQYQNRIATVVGGKGQLGSRIVKQFQALNFKEVKICQREDSFKTLVPLSTDIFFAIDDKQIKVLLASTKNLFHKNQTILDGASVKDSLVDSYLALDKQGVSVCSTHLGAIPTQPWRGVKVWVCEVGLNSEKAKKLAFDLFLPKNPFIRVVNIAEHSIVQSIQSLTFMNVHAFLAGLKNYGLTLEKFYEFSTLNAELLALPLGRTLGQGTKVPSEILFNNPQKHKYLSALKKGLEELQKVLGDKDQLKKFMNKNIKFHNNPSGFIDSIFLKAGIIGARNANLRMFSFSFKILDDQPGKLRSLLDPFYKESVNITAIDSMPADATEEELLKGVDPDKVVRFDIGIDPQTINQLKEKKIKKELEKLGCLVDRG